MNKNVYFALGVFTVLCNFNLIHAHPKQKIKNCKLEVLDKNKFRIYFTYDSETTDSDTDIESKTENERNIYKHENIKLRKNQNEDRNITKLSNKTYKVWITKDKKPLLDIKDVEQGSVGDCWFLSSVLALVQNGKLRLENNITGIDSDGTIGNSKMVGVNLKKFELLSFEAGQHIYKIKEIGTNIKVSFNVDDCNVVSKSQVIWPKLMEHGMLEYIHNEDIKKIKNGIFHSGKEKSLKDLEEGYPGAAFCALGCKEVVAIDKNYPRGRCAKAFKDMILDALENSKPCVVCTLNDLDKSSLSQNKWNSKLQTQHAYFVKGRSEGKDDIILGDPHNPDENIIINLNDNNIKCFNSISVATV